MKAVSVILPAYNEAGNIRTLVAKVGKAFEQCRLDGEAVLIDDGSTDGTGDIARECRKEHSFLRVYAHRRNLGLTRALATGFKRAKGDVIIFLCADLQSDPEEDIPKLLEGFKDGADVVVGWRQDRQESKKWGSKVYNYLSKVLFDVHVHDQNWIKAFRRNCAKNMVLRSDWHRFIVAIAVAEGYKVAEVKTNWYPRTYGQSKFGYRRIINAFLDMIVLKLQMLFYDSPIRFFGGAGLVSLLGGALIGLLPSLMKFLGHLPLTEPARLRLFFVSSLMILLGAGMLGMGILGEFLLTRMDQLSNSEQNDDNDESGRST